MMASRGLALTLTLTLASLASSPCWASALFDPADRSSADAIRTLDLARMLETGAQASGEAREAFERLPDRCHEGGRRAVADHCDDALRCQWLSARFEAVRAWSRRDEAAKRAAGARLHLLAGGLDSGRRCERGSRAGERWAADADLALVDAALVDLSLLVERGPGPGGPVVEPEERARIEALVRAARARGLAALSRDALMAASGTLRIARSRHDWLDAQPNIARLREGLLELWGPLGGVPENCGDRLLEGRMLSDRWRGYVIREVVPEALTCLGARYPRALRSGGHAARDPQVRTLVAALVEDARRDAGGRSFGQDPVVGKRVAALVEGLSPRAPEVAEARAKPPAPKPSGPAKKTTPKAAARPKEPAPDPKPEPKRSVSSAPGRVDAGLVAQAERVSSALGGRDDLVASARKARGPEARSRVLQSLIVTLHRAVCAPLESVDPSDLDAVRRVLSGHRIGTGEAACRQVEGERGLDLLLRAAPRLQRERWAAEMRGAARAAALGQPARARDELEGVPEEFRGATWHLLRAWVARIENDPVTASRSLARIDAGTLARVRSSAHEGLARVAAHAWTATRAH